MELINLDSLGLCEHCKTPLTVESMPADAIDTDWLCPKCNKVLTHESFGYQKVGEKFKRVKWVGPDQKWVEKRPEKDFVLGDWNVITGRIQFYPCYC